MDTLEQLANSELDWGVDDAESVVLLFWIQDHLFKTINRRMFFTENLDMLNMKASKEEHLYY